ncbi:MAG: M48 family metallopeptidase, partial [Synechococcales bacterium]|nr:M48 family metallopeptidase [Synechococcales bacterium]
TLANLIVLTAGQIPLGGWLTQGWQEQLMRWVRCAELTCDRAALLATQDPRITMSVLMKLSGGSPSLVDQLNLEAFVEQARAYDRASQDDLGSLLRQMQTAQLTHPLPVLRAREIDQWARSAAYQALLQPHSQSGATSIGWKNW